jgi:hypothetical protein
MRRKIKLPRENCTVEELVTKWTSFCFSKKQLEYNYIILLGRLQWQIQVCDYVMVKTTFYSKLSRLGGLVRSTRT